MTPFQIAKAHCANYQPNGSCLGTHIDDQLRPRFCKPKPACDLATPGIRCTYFEECVMPMAAGNWPGLETPRQHEDFAEAIRQYRRSANVTATTPSRLCPQCNEREVERRRRLCTICKAQNRRQSTRRAMAQKRGSDVSS